MNLQLSQIDIQIIVRYVNNVSDIELEKQVPNTSLFDIVLLLIFFIVCI